MFQQMLANVRALRPRIHCITNYVTANDCANLLLACGASPIMADDENEAWDIASICAGLNLNIGTLNPRKLRAMGIAGTRANGLGRPVVLDPVGVGASGWRAEAARSLLETISFTVIRGNASEIKALAFGSGTAAGVDANLADQITQDNLEAMTAFAKAFAEKTGSVITITGAIDIVADSHRVYCIRNGHPMMSYVTGAGCQLSALTAAFVAANPEKPLEAAAAAVCAMGLAGEIAYERLSETEGNAAYRTKIIDAIFRMTPEMLKEGAKFEVR